MNLGPQLFAICLAAMPPMAFATPATQLVIGSDAEPGVADWLDSMLADLDAPDPGRRARAIGELTAAEDQGDERLSLALVEQRLARAARGEAGQVLSVEQRSWLERCGRRLFGNSARAGMGVQFGRFDGGGGVEINGTVPNFDAARVLRAGDVLHGIDDFAVTFRSDARAAIISYDPGSEINLRLVRNGEPMTVRLRLGSFDNLVNTAPIDTGTLDLAWEIRGGRLRTLASEAVAEAPISIERWIELGNEAERQARGGQADPLLPHRAINIADPGAGRQPAEIAPGGEMRVTVAPDPSFRHVAAPEDAGIPANLKIELQRLNDQLRGLDQALRQRNLDPRGRRSIEMNRSLVERRRNAILAQLKMLQR